MIKIRRSQPSYLYNGNPHTWKNSLYVERGPTIPQRDKQIAPGFRSEQPSEWTTSPTHEGPVCGAVSDGTRAPVFTLALPSHAHGSSGVSTQWLTDTRQPGTLANICITLFNVMTHVCIDELPGPNLNIKTVFPRYGDSLVKDKTFTKPSYL